MKVYVCEMYDGHYMDTFVIGVFSTSLKAQEAGTAYLSENANGAKVIDWIRDGNDFTDWYTDNDNYNYSRHITEVELDKALAQSNSAGPPSCIQYTLKIMLDSE